MTVSHVDESFTIKAILSSITCGVTSRGDPVSGVQGFDQPNQGGSSRQYTLALREIIDDVNRIKEFCVVCDHVLSCRELSDHSEMFEVW